MSGTTPPKEDRIDSTRALKRLLFLAVGVFVSVIILGVVAEPDDASDRPATRPAVGSGYSHDELERAANMTQQMSAPSANTGSQAHADDEQLRRSQQDPGYVGALEQHQAGLDAMLARGTP
jgi:hypothetical protein